MNTELLPTKSPAELSTATLSAVAWLRAGEPVALPTETVYGLAADALRPEAVARIFEAKDRPFFDPLICHLPDASWLDRVAEIPQSDRLLVERLCARFWPGPFTMVLPKRPVVADLVTSGLPSVAVRLSAHPVLQHVLRAFGSPVAAPSANRFGRISPTTAEHVLSELRGRIPLVLDAGPASHGLESTVVAVQGGALRLLRPGPITQEELSELAPLTALAAPSAAFEAPGQLPSHYAPNTPLRLLPEIPAGLRDQTMGVLAWSALEHPERFRAHEILSRSGDPVEAAATLFARLRRLDAGGHRALLAETPPPHGLGLAILDRLQRAAAKR